jgi:DNA ligase-1
MSVSGTFSEMQQYAGRKDMEDKPGIFHLFDMVRQEEFFGKAETRTPYTQRRSVLERTFMEVKAHESSVLDIVSVYAYGALEQKEGMTEAEAKAKAEEQIMRVHEELLLASYEGSMLKDIDGYYECKRSWNIQKIKDMDNIDLTVIGVDPGLEGSKYENTMGSLVVEYKGHPVNVGSGFSDEQRANIWANKEDIINKVIEVKYFEESKDRTGKLSLRFPIFIQFRYDKE